MPPALGEDTRTLREVGYSARAIGELQGAGVLGKAAARGPPGCNGRSSHKGPVACGPEESRWPRSPAPRSTGLRGAAGTAGQWRSDGLAPVASGQWPWKVSAGPRMGSMYSRKRVKNETAGCSSDPP